MIAFLAMADRVFAWLLRAAILATSAIVTLSLVALVIFRVFFSQSLLGMHEASLLAAMWLYMAGAVMASRRSEHLVVDFLATSLRTPRARAIHGLVVAVLTLVIAAIFALWVWKMLAWGMKRPQIIPVLNLPLWYAQAPLALAAVSAVLYALRDVARAGLQIAQSGKGA
ncbi:TRAP transporter small permease (plasmid) [Paracoccus sp. TD-10]|uniref:TRAP transporter small permease n=1 Tax=Paracoccus sp. TD-10 TaxID=3395918 RepID=UPI003AAB0261